MIGFGGSLSVTVGPRQAIAVHTGAKGNGVSVPDTAQQVSVIFSENATTTFGEVSGFVFAGLAWLAFVALMMLTLAWVEYLCGGRCSSAW